MFSRMTTFVRPTRIIQKFWQDLPMSLNGGINVKLISPATTPCSTQDEERCLTNSHYPGDDYKRKWKSSIWSLIPSCMVIVSIIQILVFLLIDEGTSKLLRFEPTLRWQCYRFVTYMLMHIDKIHLILNVIIQTVLAVTLEVEQGGVRTIVVYLSGGIFGALGACILQPQPMVGASAGIYALLVSNIAHIFLNFDSVKYRLYRLFCVFSLAGSDIVYCVVHARTDGYPSISLGAHGSGGLAGLLLGFVVYKTVDEIKSLRLLKRYVFWISLFLTLTLFVTSISLIVVLPSEYFGR